MSIEHLKEKGIDIAVVSGDEMVIVDMQSALDLVMTVKYETGAERIVIDKDAVCEDFFILSTGMAGSWRLIWASGGEGNTAYPLF